MEESVVGRWVGDLEPADRLAAAENARRTAAAIAGGRLESYEGAPHGLFLADPERFNRDLPGFARS